MTIDYVTWNGLKPGDLIELQKNNNFVVFGVVLKITKAYQEIKVLWYDMEEPSIIYLEGLRNSSFYLLKTGPGVYELGTK